EYLIQRARPFIFSTAPPPALASAIYASLTLIEQEPERRERVRELAARLRTRLTTAGVPIGPGTSHIVPVLIGDNDAAVAVAGMLQRDGFDVRAIRPPTVPPGTARLRVSVNANLTEDLIEQFVVSLTSALAGRAAGRVTGRVCPPPRFALRRARRSLGEGGRRPYTEEITRRRCGE